MCFVFFLAHLVDFDVVFVRFVVVLMRFELGGAFLAARKLWIHALLSLQHLNFEEVLSIFKPL